MTLPSLPFPRIAVALIALLGGLAMLYAGWANAQVEGDRGIAPLMVSTDINVGGIEINVTGDNAEEARQKGWREAQRMAWEKLGGPDLSDSQLQGLVSAIVIQQEETGPRRYVATLGVAFDRQRASGYLGSSGETRRSAPMLVLPVTVSGGTDLMYQQVNPWQRAWAEYQPGASRIDYVRPSGAGGESLLLTYGQTGRRSRNWWATIIDQFGAADVLVPIARLDYSYPGGPIVGSFTARHGPDNEYLGSFTMRADSPRQLNAMLERAVARFDEMFVEALAAGTIRPDPTLDRAGGMVDADIARLIAQSRAILARAEAARNRPTLTEEEASVADANAAQAGAAEGGEGASVINLFVNVPTPDAAAFDAALATVRGTPGVRGASVSSTAIGGTSVLSVSYAGTVDDLIGALAQGGYNVQRAGNNLTISR
ncbi:heavy-metal-associated domain-containing protein [Citromicrobium bathyomarinum]|uniref:heavy-metal-associated domain-containing protein n=1 Tax=Citromicrobium bathyomarinum TaxID=72174 RepID=UPI00315A1513